MTGYQTKRSFCLKHISNFDVCFMDSTSLNEVFWDAGLLLYFCFRLYSPKWPLSKPYIVSASSMYTFTDMRKRSGLSGGSGEDLFGLNILIPIEEHYVRAHCNIKLTSSQ